MSANLGFFSFFLHLTINLLRMNLPRVFIERQGGRIFASANQTFHRRYFLVKSVNMSFHLSSLEFLPAYFTWNLQRAVETTCVLCEVLHPLKCSETLIALESVTGTFVHIRYSLKAYLNVPPTRVDHVTGEGRCTSRIFWSKNVMFVRTK